MQENRPQLPTRSDRPYKIGELAKITHTTPRTLRYYEELNLLSALRNDSGQRLYGEDALIRLNYINELKAGGFTLSEIKTFFDSWQNNVTGDKAANATMNLIQNKLNEIAELQVKLTKLNQELNSMFSFLVNCKNCDDRPSESNCMQNCSKHEAGQDRPALLMNLLKTIEKEPNLDRADPRKNN